LLLVCAPSTLRFLASNSSPLNNYSASEVHGVDLEAEAKNLRSSWTAKAIRRSNHLYEDAAERSLLDDNLSLASESFLRSGDGWFLLSEYKEAINSYKRSGVLAKRAANRSAEVRALSNLGRVHSYLGDNQLAQQLLRKAQRLVKNTSDVETQNVQAEVRANLGEVNYATGDLPKAMREFEHARKLSQDPDLTARIHLFLGYIAGSTGQADSAIQEILKALQLYGVLKDRRGLGQALSALGLAYSFMRDEDRSIKLHRQAIEMFRSVGDRHSEAVALNGLGQAYENLGEFSIAIDNYQQALARFQSIGAIDLASVSAFKVAKVHRLSGDLEQALDVFVLCLQLSRRAHKRRTEINAMTEIAEIQAAQGNLASCLAQQQKVLKFYRGIDDHRGEASALNSIGNSLFTLGHKQQGLGNYQRALRLGERAGDKGLVTAILYNLARAYGDFGSLEIARSYIDRSLDQIERLRTNVASLEFRSSYFAVVRKHYELAIDILMKLDRAHPGQGFDVEAFLMSEKSRARSLLDSIGDSEQNLRRLASLRLIEKSAEVTQLRAVYGELQAQLREDNRLLISPDSSRTLTLEQIRSHLPDPGTMMLELILAEERSFLWVITRDSFRSFELPPQQVIEDATREVYELATARQRLANGVSPADLESLDSKYAEKSSILSRMLLGPIVEQLEHKRLIIVADGALQYLPFDSLTLTPGQSLIETNEIVRLPSISTLVAIRSRKKRDISTDKIAAVIADPVFSRDDERLERGLFTGGLPPITTVPTRLSHAAAEVDAVSSVAPRGTIAVASGFDANREQVMRMPIGDYQIVHFATHAFVDRHNPELSGLVLSLMDENGDDQNGRISLHDVHGLDLNAELTVLSACQTGLGKDIKGEGLVGLTYGFLSAGSNSVVASLWKVDDRATALLMSEFYKLMFEQDMTPSAALRLAKLKLMRNKQWSAPYYWAGFVLQGEYTNRIKVERSPSPQVPSWLWMSLVVSVFAASLIRKNVFRSD
jgi:CHAT domain-containing protein